MFADGYQDATTCLLTLRIRYLNIIFVARSGVPYEEPGNDYFDRLDLSKPNGVMFGE
ncbi:hypothetical protein [Dictyobacter aurantiacus]|uniref:Uncharacterized protein n=1 Tax=Dictyobacter aurantiacus TaxID=1936993 RepID=A0A401ZQQ4_9CHLR|nr:hypothetical protein [Dictyobacter aurantiacus]GCE09199.1 hypothetical protein KDAU_65280 [Dictyobacter aurantiacus]